MVINTCASVGSMLLRAHPLPHSYSLSISLYVLALFPPSHSADAFQCLCDLDIGASYPCMKPFQIRLLSSNKEGCGRRRGGRSEREKMATDEYLILKEK